MLKETYIELVMTKDLEHPNIAKHLYTVKQTVADKDKYHLIMEYIDGNNLSEHISKNNKLKTNIDISEISLIGRQIVLGTEYLHNKGIIH